MATINLDRRSFLKAAGGLGALSVAGAGLAAPDRRAFADETAFPEQKHGNPVEATIDPKTGDVTVNEDVIVRNSACLGCYSSCGNRLKLDRASGRLLSVGGNPYHPSCAYPYLNFEDPLEEAYRTMSFAHGKGNIVRATVCGRGQGTQNGYSQPDRVTVPLKRAGKRGEGKWRPITWDQLITEVTEGGKLFADIGENQDIEGFKALHDTEKPMNPDQPDLGPISNQVVFLGGHHQPVRPRLHLRRLRKCEFALSGFVRQRPARYRGRGVRAMAGHPARLQRQELPRHSQAHA